MGARGAVKRAVRVKAAALSLTAFLLLPAAVAHGEESEFEKWSRQEETSLRQFQEARDREFADFLKREWLAYRALAGAVQNESPKPTALPVAPSAPVAAPAAGATRVQPQPEVEGPLAAADREEQVPGAQAGGLALTFFGTTMAFDLDPRLVPELASPMGQEAIASFWAALSQEDWSGFLSQAEGQRERTGLGDWGHYLLLDRVAVSLCGGDPHRRVLVVWFLLNKAGYDARVGYSGDRVHLLLRTSSELFQVPYLELGGQTFYVVSAAPGGAALERLFTYDGTYPGADRPLDLHFRSSPRLGSGRVERELVFQFGGREHRIPVAVSRPAVEYFAAHPQTAYDVYFAAGPSPMAEQALLRGLRPLVAKMTEREAVALLLRFVQTAFEYKTDTEQFAAEKPLFVEETLFYPYSDCEDRSVLFAYLVRRLLGLPVVGLHYPGHVATAVRLTDDVAGETVAVGQDRYLICDPTYINADPGKAIPDCSGMTPRIIAVGL